MASKIISFQEDIHIVVVVVVCGNENEKEIGCNKEHCRSGDGDGMREVKSFIVAHRHEITSRLSAVRAAQR